MNRSLFFQRIGRFLLATAATATASIGMGAPTTVPVRFIEGLPIVSVKLGDLTADFVVDTGGQIGITIPRPLVVEAAQVTLRDDFERSTDAAGHVASAQRLTARSVVLTGVDLGPVEGLVHYRWGLSVGNEAAPEVTKRGAIGFKALSTKNVLFDFPHGSMVLFDRHGDERPDVSAWEKVNFDYDARGVIVTLQVNGVDAVFSLDTAATASVIRKDARIFSKHRSPCSTRKPDAQFCGILELSGDANGAKLGKMQFAVVQMGKIPFDGLIGFDFFRAHKVFVDFDSKAIYVETKRK